MKSFYAFICALAVVFTASAAPLNINVERTASLRGTEIQVKKDANQLRQTTKKTISTESKLAGKHVTGMRKADSNASIEGTWTFLLGDYYFQNSVGAFYYDFEAVIEDGYLYFDDPLEEELSFVGIYDEITQTITFPQVYFGYTGVYHVFQMPYEYNQGRVIKSQIVAQCDVEKGIISFEAENGLEMGAYYDDNAQQKAGSFSVYDIVYAYEDFDEEEAEQWKTIGNATFVDAWIIPSYTMNKVQINPYEYTHEVELQQNVENENLFRLWKPYTNGEHLLDANNLSNFDGQIVFDVTDPDYVEVVACGKPSGFFNSNGEFFVSNELGWFVNAGYPKDFVISFLYEGEAADTFKDGVITINTPLFDLEPMHSVGYSWNNNPYAALIIFPVLIDFDGSVVANVNDDSSLLTVIFDYNAQYLHEGETVHVVLTCDDPEFEYTTEVTGGSASLEFEEFAKGTYSAYLQVKDAEGEVVAESEPQTYSVGTSGIVEVELGAAAGRFYNLQGIEIETPEAGNVYILKNGNKATKVLVK